jgi:cell division protein FtsB
MPARTVPVALITLLLVLHGQLWFGRGSVPKVAHLQNQFDLQVQLNLQAQTANNQLSAEIRDLKEGLEMVEEKARMELGMIKSNEVFVQIAR